MRKLRLLGIAVGVLLVAEVLILAIDPLNRFIFRLECLELAGAGWRGGFWKQIELSEPASAQNLVDSFSETEYFRLVEAKQVWFPARKAAPKCIVALVDSNQGRKICLFQYQPWTDNWKGRMYDP